MRYATVLAAAVMVTLGGATLQAAAPEPAAAAVAAPGTPRGDTPRDIPPAALPALAARPDPLALQLRNERARMLYLLGKQQCAHARYGDGLRALGEAHALERLPELLFEMAACHGQAGAMARAFELHRRYVDSFQDPVQRLVAAARFGAIMQQVRETAKAKHAPMPKAPPQ